MANPRAGQPAAPEDLVNVAKLVTAYYAVHPDPADVAQRVSFGTSGHRGSAFTASFNEDHILAATQAICDYRAGHDIDGPLYLGADTHALSEPAQVTALEVLAANGFVTTSFRATNRYSVAGRPPTALGRDISGVGSITSRRVRIRCRFVADTSRPSAAAYRSRNCAIVNVGGASANPMFV